MKHPEWINERSRLIAKEIEERGRYEHKGYVYDLADVVTDTLGSGERFAYALTMALIARRDTANNATQYIQALIVVADTISDQIQTFARRLAETEAGLIGE